MTARVQTLGAGDVSSLRDLLAVYADAFEDHASYQSNVPDDAYLAGLLAKEHFITIVALVDGQVVGGLSAYQLDKFEQDRREIYIYDLAVLEQHRRKGLATALIEELKRIAAERGVYVIFVQADVVDGPAIALYESFGIKETAYHFDIVVPPTQQAKTS